MYAVLYAAILWEYTSICCIADSKSISWLVFVWLIGTVHAEPETVISRAWVQSPDPAE